MVTNLKTHTSIQFQADLRHELEEDIYANRFYHAKKLKTVEID
jgi:hypothetical protein